MSIINEKLPSSKYSEFVTAGRAMLDTQWGKRQNKIREASFVEFLPSNPSFTNDVPKAVRDIGVFAIYVEKHCLLVYLHVVGRRLFLVVYPEGVDGAGTVKLTEGLWYWNGEYEDLPRQGP